MGNECDVSERIFGDLRGVQMLKNYKSVIEILNFKRILFTVENIFKRITTSKELSEHFFRISEDKVWKAKNGVKLVMAFKVTVMSVSSAPSTVGVTRGSVYTVTPILVVHTSLFI